MNKFKVLDNGLNINKISKTYGNKEGYKKYIITIKRGEIVGLLVQMVPEKQQVSM